MSCIYCQKECEPIFEDSRTLVYLTLGELRNHKMVHMGAPNGNDEQVAIDYMVNYCPMCGSPVYMLQPLDIDELRNWPLGDPLYIVIPIPYHERRWEIPSNIVPRTDRMTCKGGGTYFFDGYGDRWLAYRRPPEVNSHGS